ncbi:MAG: FHA domain-containing protein [Planctomycetes bacterium]|nr:FHA domain-containing protein [Planctomycetota bacterium]
MAKLTVMFGADPQSEHSLDKDQMKVGRAMDCDIVVDNLGVSRHHCTIVKEGDNWAVVDGGSNNGTYVGGQKIQKHVLKHGERIILGKHSLVYDHHGYAAANAATASKKGPGAMGGEMTMFVDQAQLAKAMASEVGGKRMALVLKQGGRDVVVPLLKDETVLGAADNADIPAKGFLVKPVQAKVVKNQAGHRIVSQGGWRAVKVNGQKVADAPLKQGDVIQIAGSSFTYRPA